MTHNSRDLSKHQFIISSYNKSCYRCDLKCVRFPSFLLISLLRFLLLFCSVCPLVFWTFLALRTSRPTASSSSALIMQTNSCSIISTTTFSIWSRYVLIFFAPTPKSFCVTHWMVNLSSSLCLVFIGMAVSRVTHLSTFSALKGKNYVLLCVSLPQYSLSNH